MYGQNTPFSEVIADVAARGACAGALDHFSQYQDEPLKDVIPIFAEPKYALWALWLFREFRFDFPQNLQQSFWHGLIQTPSTALLLYLHIPDLTDAQDNILYHVINDNLPTATQEINDGEVNRAKDQAP